MKNEEFSSIEQAGIIADPNRRIPKYCTSVMVSRLTNDNIIMTFLENDSLAAGGPNGINGSVLIERILFDKEHFISVFGALQKVVDDLKKKDI